MSSSLQSSAPSETAEPSFSGTGLSLDTQVDQTLDLSTLEDCFRKILEEICKALDNDHDKYVRRQRVRSQPCLTHCLLLAFLLRRQRIGVNLAPPFESICDYALTSVEYESLPKEKYPAISQQLLEQGPACAMAWHLLESGKRLPDTFHSGDNLRWIFHTSSCLRFRDDSERWQVILVAVADPESWTPISPVRQAYFDKLNAEAAMEQTARSNNADPGDLV